MGQPELQWREITGDHEALEQAYRLRVLAWRTQVALPPEMEIWKDPVDNRARHWAFFDADLLVAAVRLSMHPSIADMPHPEVYQDLFREDLPTPIAYYSRSAVHPSYRKRGLLSKFHDICAEAAFGSGAACVVSIAGSVDANRFVGASLVRRGFFLAGEGRPYSSAPYEPARPPSIYVRLFRKPPMGVDLQAGASS